MPRRGHSKFHFNPTVAGSTLGSTEAAEELQQLLFIHVHLSWPARKPGANTNTPHTPALARQLSCCSRTCQSRSAGGGTLTPGNWEELAASPCLPGLHSSASCGRGLWAAPGLRRSRSLQALMVFAFGGAENKSGQLMRKCWVGQLCGACFSSNSTFSMC